MSNNLNINNQDFTFNAGTQADGVNNENFLLNNLNLNDGINYLITNTSRTPDYEINEFKTPNGDGKNLISRFIRGGKIVIDILVKGKNSADFMHNLNVLMAEINKKNLNLKCLINGLIYEGKVTNSSSPINFAHYNTYWAPLQLQFNYYDFLNDGVQKSKNFVVNQNNLIQNIEYTGFAPSFPNIYFFIYENISNLKIEKGDDGIQIKGALVPGDTIQIDLENFDILKNGQKVDFDGTDFFFEQGDNNILISFDGETQTNQIAQCFIFYKNNFY